MAARHRPSITSRPQQPPTPPRVKPKKSDEFWDRPQIVKNLQGAVIFVGTPRQWKAWVRTR